MQILQCTINKLPYCVLFIGNCALECVSLLRVGTGHTVIAGLEACDLMKTSCGLLGGGRGSLLSLYSL